MSNLRSHTPFFTSYFTSTFACSLSTHLVDSPVFKAESGQPLSIEDKCWRKFWTPRWGAN